MLWMEGQENQYQFLWLRDRCNCSSLSLLKQKSEVLTIASQQRACQLSHVMTSDIRKTPRTSIFEGCDNLPIVGLCSAFLRLDGECVACSCDDRS